MAVSIIVNRLYVLTEDGKVAYDEYFHRGVNIIRGENSSGKSTITHLLFYGLGGDYTHFVAEARHCSQVMVEVSLSKATLTLARRINKDETGRVLSQQPMTIYWGSLDEALADKCHSETHGYQSTANRRSFSEVLFQILGIPIVQGDNNITMHQLLRLLYIDQESPTSSLFLYEPYDEKTTRETVADLLLGVFDDKLYEAKRKLKKLEEELSEVKSDLRVFGRILNKQQRSPEYIQGEIDRKNKEIDELDSQIMQLRRGEKLEKTPVPLTEKLKQEVISLERASKEIEDNIVDLDYDIQDTQLFIDEIVRKQIALNHSESTRQILGTLKLEYCPECLSPLPQETSEGVCHLCHQKVESQNGVTQARRLVQELEFQKEESENILKDDKTQLMQAQAKKKSLKAQLRDARKQLDVQLGKGSSSVAEKIEDLNFKKGEIKGELLQYYTMLENAERYAQYLESKKQLESEIKTTEKAINERMVKQEARRELVMKKIQEHGVYFLTHDEDRQRNFIGATPSDFTIDFTNNIFFLRDRNYKYSASSTFFLKLVARFSIFFASLDVASMRYPRFIFADNMEDKGIEIERAQKFQKTLIDSLKKYDTDSYQVIYTTSYITDELDHSDYVVGEHYNMQHKSLKNVSL